MPKLFLHIGTEKTGSTSIQNTLFNNYDELLAQGILYPRCFKRPNHVELAVSTQKFQAGSELYDVVGLNGSEESILSFHDEVFKNLAHEVALSGAHTVILSNEHLHSRTTSISEVEFIHKKLVEIFDEIELIVYLREQLDLVVSHYSTRVKGGFSEPFSLPSLEHSTKYCDYWSMLEMWSTKFPVIHCRVFHKNQLFKNDVVQDFSRLIGLSLGGFRLSLEDNTSLGVDTLEVLRRLNKHLNSVSINVSKLDRNHILDVFSHIDSGKKRYIPGVDVNSFRSLYFESNMKVSEKYFDGNPIFTEVKSYEGREYVLSLDEYDELMFKFWIELKRRLDWKGKKIFELNKILESKNG